MDFDKDIPIPENKYEFIKRFELGESKFFPLISTRGNFYKGVRTSAKKFGFKIKAKSIDGGLRIWRVE